MQHLRPFLTALLGLTLWVQGLAIAAAPVAAPEEPGSTMEMPCHGEAAPCDCCDDGCTDMAGCVIGHFVAAPATTLHVAPPARTVATATGWSSKTAVLPLPLRPPIVAHA